MLIALRPIELYGFNILITYAKIFVSLSWLLDEGFREANDGALQYSMKKHGQEENVFKYIVQKIETFTETAYYIKGSGVCNFIFYLGQVVSFVQYNTCL